MQGDSTAAASPPTPAEQKNALAAKARDLGLEAFGVAAVPAELRQAYFREWIQRGEHGEMAWMARDPDRRSQPETLIPGARSVIVVGQNYYQPEPTRRGRISKYALGKDYHKVILRKLKQLCTLMREWGGVNRPYVDTGPLLEKPLAALAGIGWQAKNTLVINQSEGQWLLLGNIVTTLDLPADEPPKDRCGSCTRCIDVCPTQAITAPYQLDARRCIAYLTIEHGGSIPVELRSAIGDHLFGCDDCLDICPWNRWAQQTREERYAARIYPDLREMLAWDEAVFLETFSGTPIRRLGFARWLRNVAVVLGNTGTPADLPALERHTTSPEPLIQEHARWAVAEIRRRFPGTVNAAER